MLPLALVEEIDRQLQSGQLSQRQIAARLGVSRGTVNAIANGRRGIHGRDPTLDDPDTIVPSVPPERCPRCGFRVYVPCLVCRTREYRDLRRVQQELAALLGRAKGRTRSRARPARGRRPKRSRVA